MLGDRLNITESPKKRCPSSEGSSSSNVERIDYSDIKPQNFENLTGFDLNKVISKDVEKLIDIEQAPIELKHQLYETFKSITKHTPFPQESGYTEALVRYYIQRTLQDTSIFIDLKSGFTSSKMIPEQKLNNYYSSVKEKQVPKYYINGKLDFFVKNGDKILIVELKYINLLTGIHQLALQLRGARDEYNVPKVFGILSSGSSWLLMILDDKEYHISKENPYIENDMFQSLDKHGKNKEWFLKNTKLIDIFYQFLNEEITSSISSSASDEKIEEIDYSSANYDKRLNRY